MQEAWLDIMPVIPLDRGVPVVYRASDGTQDPGIVLEVGPGTQLLVWFTEHGEPIEVDASGCSVDLESPGGIAHALRWVALERGRRAGVKVDDVLLPLKPDRHYRLLVATRCVEMAG